MRLIFLHRVHIFLRTTVKVSEDFYQQFLTGFCFLFINLSGNINHLILDDSSELGDFKQVTLKLLRELESIKESKYIKMSNDEFGKIQSLYFSNTRTQTLILAKLKETTEFLNSFEIES